MSDVIEDIPVDAGIEGTVGATPDVAADVALSPEMDASFTPGASSDEPLTEKTTIWENYAAAGILNLDANNDALTSQAQQAYKEAYCSADGTTFVAAAEEKEKKKEDAVSALEIQAEERERQIEERRALSEKDKEILQNQYTEIGGKKISVLDLVNSMDEKLNDWDHTFNDMVANGYAKEDESEKKKQELIRLRNLWARTDISPEQKKIEEQKMVAAGKISQETVDYNNAKMSQENVKNSAEATADVVQRAGLEQKTSVEEGKSFFSTEKSNPSSVSTFTSSAQNEIKSSIQPTEEFNSKASVIELQNQKPVTKLEIASTMTVSNTANSMGFG